MFSWAEVPLSDSVAYQHACAQQHRGPQLVMPAHAAARRRLKVVAAHMPAIDLGWIVAVSALASVCASLGLYAAAVWRQWRRDVYRAQFVRTRETF